MYELLIESNQPKQTGRQIQGTDESHQQLF
jgi:hypothetical protein